MNKYKIQDEFASQSNIRIKEKKWIIKL